MWDIYKNSGGNALGAAEEMEVIEDPEFLFSSAFDEIRTRMEEIQAQLGIDCDQLDGLIKEKYPGVYPRLWGRPYERVNTDIWGRYENGTLTTEELEGWKRDLETWKRDWLGVLDDISKANQMEIKKSKTERK